MREREVTVKRDDRQMVSIKAGHPPLPVNPPPPPPDAVVPFLRAGVVIVGILFVLVFFWDEISGPIRGRLNQTKVVSSPPESHAGIPLVPGRSHSGGKSKKGGVSGASALSSHGSDDSRFEPLPIDEPSPKPRPAAPAPAPEPPKPPTAEVIAKPQEIKPAKPAQPAVAEPAIIKNRATANELDAALRAAMLTVSQGEAKVRSAKLELERAKTALGRSNFELKEAEKGKEILDELKKANKLVEVKIEADNSPGAYQRSSPSTASASERSKEHKEYIQEKKKSTAEVEADVASAAAILDKANADLVVAKNEVTRLMGEIRKNALGK